MTTDDRERRDRALKLFRDRFPTGVWNHCAYAVAFAFTFSDQENSELRAELAKAREALERCVVGAEWKSPTVKPPRHGIYLVEYWDESLALTYYDGRWPGRPRHWAGPVRLYRETVVAPAKGGISA